MSIPELPKQWKPSEAPEFVRFVMGEFLPLSSVSSKLCIILKLACIELNRYVHDELTVSTSLSTSSVPLSLLREVRNC